MKTPAARLDVTGWAARSHARQVPVVLGAATVASQIAYPLVSGGTRDAVTVTSVALFFAASVSHAAVWRGTAWAGSLVAVTAGGGLAVEAIGVATGAPFGAYTYTGTLGPAVLGVPAVIPLAWTMMAYPALLVGRRVATDFRRGGGVAAAGLATWDLFLDPQMVAAGHWRWTATGPLLGIPLTNFVGWFAVALVMMAVLWRLPEPPRPADDRVPLTLYAWTYASSVLAHAAFFGLPRSAVAGGVGMGLVVALWLRAEHARRTR